MKRLLLSCAVLTVLLAWSSQVSADWKIKSDVDLYEEPGGKGKPVGIVRKGKVFLDTQVKCRSDKWCNIPQGWIWGSFLKKVDATGDKSSNQPAQSTRWTCTDRAGLSVSSDAKNTVEAVSKFKAYVSAHNLTQTGPLNCTSSQ